jgi:hypothetical protein
MDAILMQLNMTVNISLQCRSRRVTIFRYGLHLIS